jgi:hypothetical protein
VSKLAGVIWGAIAGDREAVGREKAVDFVGKTLKNVERGGSGGGGSVVLTHYSVNSEFTADRACFISKYFA